MQRFFRGLARLLLLRAAVALTLPSTSTPRAQRVRVSHILVETKDLAKLCVQQLETGAVPFYELAEQVSTCDSKARGGDLGWISPGLMVPEFDAAAFFFAPGESATFRSDFGWHVIRVAEASYVEAAMSPAELRRRLNEPGLVLIDLRDDEERSQAIIGGVEGPFRHLPYSSWQAWAEQALEGALEPPLAPSRDSEIVFMDHRGGRGERMMQYFAQSGGYLNARHLRGGINAYSEEADASVPQYLESDGDCTTCNEH